MHRRALLATATTTTTLALSGCIAEDKPDTVTLTITSNGTYTGILQAHGTRERIGATDDTTHEWTNQLPGSIRLTLYTNSSTDATLTATIHEDNEHTKEKTVTGATEPLTLVHTV